jgi:hypothetical protein
VDVWLFILKLSVIVVDDCCDPLPFEIVVVELLLFVELVVAAERLPLLPAPK